MDNTENIKKIINCSYCGKGRHQVEQMIEGPEFGGKTIYICNECVDVTYNILHTEEADIIKKKKKEKILAPEEIKKFLDEYIIGQDGAKIAISVAFYNHYKRINNTTKTELEKSNMLMIGESGCGKAQPLYSKIKTPTGWKIMGEIKTGDVVSTPDGKTANVVGIYPQGKKDIYRITFADGRTAESCKEHLWEIYGHYGKSYKTSGGHRAYGMGTKIVDLEWIMNKISKSKISIRIPLIIKDNYPDVEQPIDPWLLGFLLGDGSFRSSRLTFSTADNEIIEKIKEKLHSNYYIKKLSGYDYSVSVLPDKLHILQKEHGSCRYNGKYHLYYKIIKSLRLDNLLSDEKFIPEIYMSGSREQRLEVIRGLIDSDGYCRNGNISFTSTSKKLAENMQELIRSVGGIAKITTKIPTYTYKGEKREGKKAYNVSIRYHTPSSLVSLDRKKEYVRNYQYKDKLYLGIKKIEYVGSEEAQCIMIDDPKHLYITDNYVVTHNTLLVKTIAKLFDLPCVIADATTLTEAGYVGEDVHNLIDLLIQNAGDDVDKARTGIIFIDEIDKKSRKSESAVTGRDVSGEGVQQALLKLIEGTVIKIDDGYDEPIDFDTKNILFVCSGAFVGLDEVVRKNRSKTGIGIGANINTKSSFSETIKEVRSDDLIKYGLIPEFVGRCPITVVFDDMTLDTLVRILKEPKNSIVEQFKVLFKYEGVILDFDDKYLYNVAENALKQKIGARGLRSIMERDLEATQFVLPKLAKNGVNKIFVDANGSIKHVYKAAKRAKNE